VQQTANQRGMLLEERKEGPARQHETAGYWYARSPEFLQTGTIELFRWMRAIGDTIFATGVVAVVLFVFGLATGHSVKRGQPERVAGVIRAPGIIEG
jgi:hypothetical protein